MFNLTASRIWEVIIVVTISILILISTFVLYSIEPSIYPTYFVYIALAIFLFLFFLRIDFDIYLAFSGHLYFLTLIFLVITLLIGQVTRGAVRWIPLGSVTIQPSEVARAFLLLYFAKYLTEKDINISRLMKLFIIFLIPFGLILVQPSLGVAILTAGGFLGVLLASSLEKKYFLMGLGIFSAILPLIWFVLAPYQRERLSSFINPESDPLGAGYNSIQSMISVGSGRLTGRGLGEGVQTQLEFLPEKHTDFIFAAISEELGFFGASLIVGGLFVVFLVLIQIVANAKNPAARAYVAGVFLILFAQSVIHMGMNMGLLPITGVPLPFVSAGGSSLLGTVIAVAISLKAKVDA